MRAALSRSGTNNTEESDAYRSELANFATGQDADLGDRRQEVVFIGTNLDTASIARTLDDCLLTEDEMQQYKMTAREVESELAESRRLRFDIGTKVECNMGTAWQKGTVIKQFYRDAPWPLYNWKPYEVELDEGSKIWVPADTDAVCRQI
jgi:hypothetical protein